MISTLSPLEIYPSSRGRFPFFVAAESFYFFQREPHSPINRTRTVSHASIFSLPPRRVTRISTCICNARQERETEKENLAGDVHRGERATEKENSVESIELQRVLESRPGDVTVRDEF